MQQIEINLFQFYKSVIKRPKTFAISTLIIIASTIIYAILLPIEYNSKVIFYCLREEEADPKLFDHLLPVDYRDNAEKFMAFGQSRQIKEVISKKYNLINRYDLDTTLNRNILKDMLFKQIDKNILFQRAPNGGIEISVFDKDKDTVALIANDVAQLINDNFASIIQKRNLIIRETHQKRLSAIKSGVDEILTHITALEKDKKSNKYLDLLQKLKIENQNYALQKLKCDQFEIFVNTKINTIEILENAQPALKKAKPKRSIIVIIGTFLGVLLWIIGFTIYDSKK